jgi:hypothetical protein
MATEHFLHALTAGRTLFEQRAFFPARDAFEAGRRAVRGDERLVLGALVLWAEAMLQHQNGQDGAAATSVEQALEKVGPVDDGFDGLDVDALREALLGALEAARHGAEGPGWLEEREPGDDEGDFQGEGVALEHRLRCPYCGESVLVVVAAEEADAAQYVEDCPVCCRPWQVLVRDGRVTLDRDEAQD